MSEKNGFKIKLGKFLTFFPLRTKIQKTAYIGFFKEQKSNLRTISFLTFDGIRTLIEDNLSILEDNYSISRL